MRVSAEIPPFAYYLIMIIGFRTFVQKAKGKKNTSPLMRGERRCSSNLFRFHLKSMHSSICWSSKFGSFSLTAGWQTTTATTKASFVERILSHVESIASREGRSNNQLGMICASIFPRFEPFLQFKRMKLGTWNLCLFLAFTFLLEWMTLYWE